MCCGPARLWGEEELQRQPGNGDGRESVAAVKRNAVGLRVRSGTQRKLLSSEFPTQSAQGRWLQVGGSRSVAPDQWLQIGLPSWTGTLAYPAPLPAQLESLSVSRR